MNSLIGSGSVQIGQALVGVLPAITNIIDIELSVLKTFLKVMSG